MKKKKLILLLFLSTNLWGNMTFADESNAGLTLTAQEIKRLDHLFNISDVPTESEQTIEHLSWRQTPLPIHLSLNHERQVTFPGKVMFGYDQADLSEDSLTVQNNHNTLYLLAHKAFARERVQVKLVDSGKIILLDLYADKDGDTTPVQIMLEEDNIGGSTHLAVLAPSSQTNDIMLMRYAVQQLYAPRRLLMDSPLFYRIPIHTKKFISLFRDKSVLAQPIASWQDQENTVTAVLLKNALTVPLTLNPNMLCGTWRAAVFYPRTLLQPKAANADSTTVFLLSTQPFHYALGGCS